MAEGLRSFVVVSELDGDARQMQISAMINL